MESRTTRTIAITAAIVAITYMGAYYYDRATTRTIAEQQQYQDADDSPPPLTVADVAPTAGETTPQGEDSYTVNEWRLMAKVVYAEARGESDLGQQAVVEVILHRLHSPLWPDTVHGVITQGPPQQFVTGDTYTLKELSNVRQVLNSYPTTRLLPSSDYYYFSTTPQRHTADPVRLGGHVFEQQ